jgi:hypothetical protein
MALFRNVGVNVDVHLTVFHTFSFLSLEDCVQPFISGIHKEKSSRIRQEVFWQLMKLPRLFLLQQENFSFVLQELTYKKATLFCLCL